MSMAMYELEGLLLMEEIVQELMDMFLKQQELKSIG
jgi:hypothetical protein